MAGTPDQNEPNKPPKAPGQSGPDATAASSTADDAGAAPGSPSEGPRRSGASSDDRGAGRPRRPASPARRAGAGSQRGGSARVGRGGQSKGNGGSQRGGASARGGGAGGRGRPSKPRQASGLEVPGGAREPIGRDRASRQSNSPPPRATPMRAAGPPRPPLPTDEQPDLPKPVRNEVFRVLGKGSKAKDVALALSIGSAAIDHDRIDVALQCLAWAKHEAPRVTAVREAYGVALYLDERFADALSELQAYRRLTGKVDQNHVIADCLRALGRDLDQIAEAAESLLADSQAPEDRRAEAAIVWAAAIADGGDVGAGRSILRSFLERRRSGDAEHDLRVRYLAADLAERARDEDEVLRQLEQIVAVDPGFLDAEERLDGVRMRRGD